MGAPPKNQVLVLTLDPKGRKKSKEIGYVAEKVGRIYLRPTVFGKGVAPPQTLKLIAPGMDKVWAEPGENRSRGGRPAREVTAETLAKMEATRKKHADRQAKLDAKIAKARASLGQSQTDAGDATDATDATDAGDGNAQTKDGDTE